MSSNIVPSAAPQVKTTITVPSDGDAASAASIVTAFTALGNDAEAYRLLLLGGGIRRRVSCTSNTVMVIQPLGAVLATVAGVWQTAAHTVASTIDPSALVALAASTRYWVYAYISGGAVSFDVDATAPEAGLRYMNGDTAYMYVSTFYTDSAGDICTYTQCDGHYAYTTWTGEGGGVDGNLVLDTAAALVVTTVPTTPAVPSAANAFSLKVCISPNAANSLGVFGRGNVTSNRNQALTIRAPNGGNDAGSFVLSSPLEFDYYVDAATTLTNVWVVEFWM